jgi:RNA polymerase sigma-70 factor (ECF subfamily)
MLRSRKSRREESIEDLIPDAITCQVNIIDPEQEAIMADSVGIALLVVLSKLNPAERITFVLHDVFAMPYHEIAPIVGKSEAAARQLAVRARHRVRGAKATQQVDLALQRDVVQAFLAAAQAGDFDALVAALDPHVILRDDRQTGASRETQGAIALAKQISGRAQKAAQLALVDGSVGIIAAPQGKLLYVLKFTINHGTITEVDLISNPESTKRLNLTILNDLTQLQPTPDTTF